MARTLNLDEIPTGAQLMKRNYKGDVVWPADAAISCAESLLRRARAPLEKYVYKPSYTASGQLAHSIADANPITQLHTKRRTLECFIPILKNDCIRSPELDQLISELKTKYDSVYTQLYGAPPVEHNWLHKITQFCADIPQLVKNYLKIPITAHC